ncbi:MAG: glycosyltransferase [Bacteroidetes bacterium]|nr:glycosyltransferase [Bacteroidota bacterium]
MFTFIPERKVLQARRVAKNETNSMSRLDSLSETINNHIFRKRTTALGFSASLIGSGMFMKLSIFRMVMEDMDVSGFDKELELQILKNRLTINYASDILVYDEKYHHMKYLLIRGEDGPTLNISFLRKMLLIPCMNLYSKVI